MRVGPACCTSAWHGARWVRRAAGFRRATGAPERETCCFWGTAPDPSSRLGCAPSVMLNARGASLLHVCMARRTMGAPRCGVPPRNGRAGTRNLQFLGEASPLFPRLGCAPSVMLRARGAVPLLDCTARRTTGAPRCGVPPRCGRAGTRRLQILGRCPRPSFGGVRPASYGMDCIHEWHKEQADARMHLPVCLSDYRWFMPATKASSRAVSSTQPGRKPLRMAQRTEGIFDHAAQ